MGSRLRKRLMDPVKTLRGADVQPGQAVLEVGCGTGFFTIPAAQLIGDEGCLVALDASSGYVEQVSKKVQRAGLKNVRIIRRDALATALDTASMDKALLFGVLPFPLLPLNRLLPEMHRVLKPEGTMAVWLFPPVVFSWVAGAIDRSVMFSYTCIRNDVYNFRRC